MLSVKSRPLLSTRLARWYWLPPTLSLSDKARRGATTDTLFCTPAVPWVEVMVSAYRSEALATSMLLRATRVSRRTSVCRVLLLPSDWLALSLSVGVMNRPPLPCSRLLLLLATSAELPTLLASRLSAPALDRYSVLLRVLLSVLAAVYSGVLPW